MSQCVTLGTRPAPTQTVACSQARQQLALMLGEMETLLATSLDEKTRLREVSPVHRPNNGMCPSGGAHVALRRRLQALSARTFEEALQIAASIAEMDAADTAARTAAVGIAVGIADGIAGFFK